MDVEGFLNRRAEHGGMTGGELAEDLLRTLERTRPLFEHAASVADRMLQQGDLSVEDADTVRDTTGSILKAVEALEERIPPVG